jgi:hypothetical protein
MHMCLDAPGPEGPISNFILERNGSKRWINPQADGNFGCLRAWLGVQSDTPPANSCHVTDLPMLTSDPDAAPALHRSTLTNQLT